MKNASRVDSIEQRHLARIAREDFPMRLLVDAGIESPGDTPSLSELNHEQRMLGAALDDEADRFAFRERPAQFDQQ